MKSLLFILLMPLFNNGAIIKLSDFKINGDIATLENKVYQSDIQNVIYFPKYINRVEFRNCLVIGDIPHFYTRMGYTTFLKCKFKGNLWEKDSDVNFDEKLVK